MRSFIKFLVIGAMNTAIDWGILNLLLILFGIRTTHGFVVAKVIGFTAAMINSFIWNRQWVFRDAGKPSLRQVGLFILVNLIGLAINTGIATVVLGVCNTRLAIGEWQFLICSNIGAAVATGASLLWNFTGYRLFVFRNRV